MSDDCDAHRQIFVLLKANIRRSAAAPMDKHLRPERRRLAFAAAFLSAFIGMSARAQPAPQRTLAIDADRAPFARFIDEAAQRFAMPAAFLSAVIGAESLGDARALSPKGAIGLMQIMPETWAALRRRYHLGADPYDAHDNILAGAAYLRDLRDRYGIPGFLAAYHAGPARWEDHIASGRPLPSETGTYLARLLPVIEAGAVDDAPWLASAVTSGAKASLFPPLSAVPPKSSQDAAETPSQPRSNDPRAVDGTGLVPSSMGLFVTPSYPGPSS